MNSKLLVSLALGALFCFQSVPAQEPPPPAKPPATAPDEATPAVTPSPAPGAEEPPTAPQPTRRSRRSSRSSHRDMVMIGAPVVVNAGETARDIVAIGSNVRIDGTVDGDLVLLLGKLTLGPSARIEKDLVVVCGVLEADPSAVIVRNPVVISPQTLMAFTNAVSPEVSQAGRDWIANGLLQARPLPLPHQSGWAWVIAGLSLALYLLVELLFPKSVQATVASLEERPASAFLAGLFGMFLVLPLLLLLAVTVVGMALVPFALCALAGMLVLGKTSLYRYAGATLTSRMGAGRFNRPALALIIGAAAFYLLYCVPVLGGVIWIFAIPLGFGAVLLTTLSRTRLFARSVPEPSGPATAASAAGSDAAAALANPRAGFWIRLLATFLDLILVLLIMGLVLKHPNWFPVAWLIYHLVFWIWRGTTVGGIICSLRIVRIDGQRLSPAVAVVRLLGSIFSLAVAGIGFFWAGWSADRQSWHDKIAGTTIVRVPKGTALI